MKKAFIFDLLTTGLPKKMGISPRDVDNFPYIVEMAWQLVDLKTQKVLSQQQYLIRPEGYEIPKEVITAYDIANEVMKVNGKKINDVLQLANTDIRQADVLVSHDTAFDIPILEAAFVREYGVRILRDKPQFCTQKQSKQYCLGSPPSGPSITRIYQQFFHTYQQPFSNPHRASDATEACKQVFFKIWNERLVMPI